MLQCLARIAMPHAATVGDEAHVADVTAVRTLAPVTSAWHRLQLDLEAKRSPRKHLLPSPRHPLMPLPAPADEVFCSPCSASSAPPLLLPLLRLFYSSLVMASHRSTETHQTGGEMLGQGRG